MTAAEPQTIAPFDVASLPRIERAELDAQAQLRALRAALDDGEPVARALEAIAGAPIQLSLRRAVAKPEVALSAEAAAPSGAVSAAFVPAAEPGRVFVVEAEGALARELVARALKQPPAGIANPTKGAPPDLHGAFAAVVVAAARALGTPLRLATDAPAPNAATAALDVTVGGATFDARVTFPPLAARRGAPDLDRLGSSPIALPIVATSCLAARAEVEALQPGDVFLAGPEETWSLALVAEGAEQGLAARVGSDDRLVITTEPAVHSWDPPMTTDSKAPLDVALEAPVVVRVEVGSVQMTAREWAALRDGDVIATGVKTAGNPAVLRIGGVEVAHGELVVVDGEYGVRITGMTKR
ncbi:MAG: FliM/FliN family flagellar motor switch protein [Labilithrix sp.]|nr:FliM/FliN family flagellar motor switch protein [Labilithrix sp.]MCW5810402.1 FliM/FliN family flagellar motor switch protein [Labilithrix sp.]